MWRATCRIAGLRPGVLTRGYGRKSRISVLTLAPGAQMAPVTHTGDEPQVLLRSGVAAVGIGADRFESGVAAESALSADVMLLDDGFQHLRLARDLDIVLIDALNPFGEGELVPLGRLREPMESLARASVFVITRDGLRFPSTAAIEARLRQLQSVQAPIFRSRVVPANGFRISRTIAIRPDALALPRTLAFCGLGTPDAFWRSLARTRHRTAGARRVRRSPSVHAARSPAAGQLGRALGVGAC